MRYTVVLEKESDGGYVASVPALPRCVSQGKDRAKAMVNIREAIESYISKIAPKPTIQFPSKPGRNS